jgi:hypothetical protein
MVSKYAPVFEVQRALRIVALCCTVGCFAHSSAKLLYFCIICGSVQLSFLFAGSAKALEGQQCQVSEPFDFLVLS